MKTVCVTKWTIFYINKCMTWIQQFKTQKLGNWNFVSTTNSTTIPCSLIYIYTVTAYHRNHCTCSNPLRYKLRMLVHKKRWKFGICSKSGSEYRDYHSVSSSRDLIIIDGLLLRAREPRLSPPRSTGGGRERIAFRNESTSTDHLKGIVI